MRWEFGRRRLQWQGAPRVRLMGVVNVTPDSFSDGGRFFSPQAAVAHALALVEAGADILDIGGESSRPGAAPIDVQEELRRVVPVVRALRPLTEALISVDTTKASVAAEALAAGAEIINDINALGDPALTDVVAATGAGVVLMHMRGRPATMQQGDLDHPDLVGSVLRFLEQAMARAEAAGIPRNAICLDPGLGFGKTVEQNVALVAELPRLLALGRPVLLGPSRKSFIGALTGRPVEGRLAGTLAACACAVMRGVHVLRVHDVAEAADAVRVACAIAGPP